MEQLFFVICGIIRPMNPMAPETLTEHPVKKIINIQSKTFSLFKFNPRPLAISSPKI